MLETEVSTERRIKTLLKSNVWLQRAVSESETLADFIRFLRIKLAECYKESPLAEAYAYALQRDAVSMFDLSWTDFAVVLLEHLIQNEGKRYYDPNVSKTIINQPLRLLWKALKGTGGIHNDLLREFEMLLLQLSGAAKQEVSYDDLEDWMERHPSGLDKKVQLQRKINRDRIISIIVEEFQKNPGTSAKYQLDTSLSCHEQKAIVEDWWEESSFHLAFAIRSAELLNKVMGGKLESETLQVMEDAEQKGLPIFVNPYYLSLLNINTEESTRKTDLAIRMYIFYSRSLVDEFGDISAWEKEDEVIVGEPNAAGWLLPSHNLHRRYPEVAILIPDTIGRACGGLCSSCQRMYGFQSGDFNFDLNTLEPNEKWPEKLERLLEYYEKDTQLRDILITGGDALMSTNKSLKRILDRTLAMIDRKVQANKSRNEKYAEITRIRLGTRLPVYLPQRIDNDLIDILAEFKERASKLGVKQLLIQTHFESAMEITPEAKTAVSMLLSAGWYVTNQQVFTSAAAVRGHTAKLRSELNRIGVLPYYTFSVKGFKENSNNFATNARIVQEMLEEKRYGVVDKSLWPSITELTKDPSTIVNNIDEIRNRNNLPFIATDRSVINIPGVGKSLSFHVAGFCDDGRRILEFSHDRNRAHSPAVDHNAIEIIIESKSVTTFLNELEEMGENPNEYTTIFGYTLCETEARMPIYKYPEYDFRLTEEVSNFRMPE